MPTVKVEDIEMLKQLLGLDKGNSVKAVVKTAKGRSPIRKVKMAIGAGALAMAISPIVEPLLMSWLGYVPDGLPQKIAETLIQNYELISALAAAYAARPGHDDGIAVEASHSG